MKTLLKFFIMLVLLLLLFLQTTFSKVDPPNYNFTLATFDSFNPEQKVEEIEKKFGSGKIIEKSEDFKTYTFVVTHLRYKFPVIVQTYQGQVLDFYATLPSFFSHDIFHQSLINKIGQQDKYLRSENNAIYIWNNKENAKHIYSGSCTITCFPLYYTKITLTPPKTEIPYKPFIEKIRKRFGDN